MLILDYWDGETSALRCLGVLDAVRAFHDWIEPAKMWWAVTPVDEINGEPVDADLLRF